MNHDKAECTHHWQVEQQQAERCVYCGADHEILRRDKRIAILQDMLRESEQNLTREAYAHTKTQETVLRQWEQIKELKGEAKKSPSG